MKIQSYQKDFDYSYAIGVYPSLELLQYRPKEILQVYFSPKASQNEGFQKIKQFADSHHLPLIENEKIVNQLSDSENAYALTVFKKYSSPLTKENHLVLDGPRDMGNLGTIIRTMVGFDYKNLVIIRPAADIFHPKAIRASMGELFQINFQYFDNFKDYQSHFSEHHLYPFLTSASGQLESANFKSPASLIFGNESSGLSSEFNQIGTPLKIAQSPNIDSLNLASAVSISLHHLFSQNRK